MSSPSIISDHSMLNSSRYKRISIQTFEFRSFKTTRRLDIHPLIWVIVRPAFQLAAGLGGR